MGTSVQELRVSATRRALDHRFPTPNVEPKGLCVRVDGLSRRVRVRNRGEATLLDGVSFSVAAGDLVAIVGPSGAGKTTLLKVMAGISPASGGSVSFDDIDVHANLRKLRGAIGYVPQDDIIHADLALRHTLRYAARLRLPSSTTRAEVDDAVATAMEAVVLGGQADVRVGSLSGGQRKRASVAVELLTDPRVFFLDEPTSGLDPATSAELIAQLRKLADRSATVVFTTHSVDDLDLCDRVVFMARGGRVAFVGTVDDALEHFGVASVPELYPPARGCGRHHPGWRLARSAIRRMSPPTERCTSDRSQAGSRSGMSSPAGRSRRSSATR